jgi:hypothetical protein
MKHRSRLATLAYLSAIHDVRVSLFAVLDQAEIRAGPRNLTDDEYSIRSVLVPSILNYNAASQRMNFALHFRHQQASPFAEQRATARNPVRQETMSRPGFTPA